MKKHLLFFLVSVILGACNPSGYDNKKVEYYYSGNIKSIKLWNNENNNEELVLFSEKGDTLERKRVIGYHIGMSRYTEDSITYSFYLLGRENFVNEFLVQKRNKEFVQKESEYLFADYSLSDTIELSIIGYNIYSFEVQVFDLNDTILEKPYNTIISHNLDPIILPKSVINEKKLRCKVTKLFEYPDGSKEEIQRYIYLNLDVKRKFQDYFFINSPTARSF